MAYTFKNIKVWQKAHELVLEIYRITKIFPASERHGLIAQLRRSATSVYYVALLNRQAFGEKQLKKAYLTMLPNIATNIVEGYKRRSDRDFAHFLNMSDASLEETKYHLLLSCDLKYMNKNDYERLSILADEIGRMLFGFQKSLQLTA